MCASIMGITYEIMDYVYVLDKAISMPQVPQLTAHCNCQLLGLRFDFNL